MNIQRLVRAGTPVEVSVLAVMALVVAVGCFGTAAFPIAENAPQGLILGFGLVAASLALALFVAGARVSPVRLHLGLVLLTSLHGVMVAAAVTERGLMLSALGYVWTAVYVAFFFRPHVARAYAVLMTIALGVGMLLARAPTGVSVWVTISAMIWVAIAVLASLNSRLRAAAHCDGLTGLLNRTGFALAAERQLAASRRRGEPVALVMIDLDQFKVVNDRDGHVAGDRLLVELSASWASSLRPGDLLARFGGDEFVLMLAGTEEHQVDAVLHRLRQVHPAPWTAGAVLCSEEESLDEAIERADRRLYAAKGFASSAAAWHRKTRWEWQPGRAA